MTFLKNQIAGEIYNIFKSMEVTQAEFAHLIGIRQAKFSRICNGHLGEFSLETLIEYLQKLNRDVELRIIVCEKSYQ